MPFFENKRQTYNNRFVSTLLKPLNNLQVKGQEYQIV